MAFFHHIFDYLNLGDGLIIKPQLMLLIFGIGILLTDYFMEPGLKYFNALMAMAGVVFSGITLCQISRVSREYTATVNLVSLITISRANPSSDRGPFRLVLWNDFSRCHGADHSSFRALHGNRAGKPRRILCAHAFRHHRHDVHGRRARPHRAIHRTGNDGAQLLCAGRIPAPRTPLQ